MDRLKENIRKAYDLLEQADKADLTDHARARVLRALAKLYLVCIIRVWGHS